MTLEKILNNIGKSTFIKYYNNFKNKTREECINAIEENFTEKSKGTRTSHAQRIFREKMNIEALKIIISSNKIDESTRKKATELLLTENEITI